MKRAVPRLLLAALAGALTLAAWLWLSRNQAPQPPEPGNLEQASEPATPIQPSATAEPAPAAPTPAASALALPPADAELVDVLPQLQARADAGDARAACRLAMELLRCQHMPLWQRQMEQVQAQTVETEISFFSEDDRQWSARAGAQCAAVPEALREAGASYLVRAARAGHPAAMTAYADGQHWAPDAAGIAVTQDFDAWRREAPQMIHAAARAGHPAAAFTLFIAYSSDHGLLAGLIEDDPYRTYVYHLLSVRLFGHKERAGFARPLSAEQVMKAQQQAERLHLRDFGGRRFHSGRSWDYPPHLRRAEGAAPFCE